MTDGLMLIGGGGHCKACIDVIKTANLPIAGIVDREGVGQTVLGATVIGTDDDLAFLTQKGYSFLITVGQIKSVSPRIRLYKTLKELDGRLATVISPSALVSASADVGEGSIVMHQAMVNAAARIGVNCIINTKALIEHDAQIGHHVHVSTAAVINGGCVVGDHSFIGSNAVLAQGVQIARDVIIGAGAVVIKNITEAGTYAGNPAKRIHP